MVAARPMPARAPVIKKTGLLILLFLESGLALDRPYLSYKSITYSSLRRFRIAATAQNVGHRSALDKDFVSW
jgi:hypothetical protein